ncbi:MAG: N-acetylneuraminate synthase family protein [Planctomycetes bacterium]|nr:N-acetylneuraminate synthase family protein [Planctomycetota bacterium]
MIGPEQPCFVIAEAGVNHNGSMELAFKLADAAKAAGADLVKFQAFDADLLVAEGAEKAGYQKQTTGGGDQRSMLRALQLSEAQFVAIKAHCDRIGIAFAASPFDHPSLELLLRLPVGLLKLGSGEITNRPLIEACGCSGLPLILSTGASTLKEVTRAVGWHQLCFRRATVQAPGGAFGFAGGHGLALLHCVSAYPTRPEETNLRAMARIAEATTLPVGFSDHTPDLEVAPLAVAAGACIVEKHLTLDRTLPGPDHAASLEPADFAEMVRRIRRVEALLGRAQKQPQPSEQDVIRVARKSLLAARDLPAGAVVGESDVFIPRPGVVEGGFGPWQLDAVVGRTLKSALKRGQPFLASELDGSAPSQPSWFGQKPPKERPREQ